MDNTEQNQTEYTREEALIDVFYKDTYRLNSLISQINNGALQSVKTTMDSVQGSISSTKGSIGVKGLFSLGTNDNTSNSTKRSIEETKMPLDNSVLTLLSQLCLSPISELSKEIFSNLQVVQGTISLQNYKILSEIIPIIGNLAVLFDENIKKKHELEQLIAILKAKSSKTADEKKRIKELEDDLLKQKFLASQSNALYNNIHVFLPFLPKGIGFEVHLDDSSVLAGTLKSEYLIDSEESISLNFGDSLPDRWNVLGIIDYRKVDFSSNGNSNSLAALSTIMKGAADMIFQSKSKATIIPLLIYRELSIE